MSYQYAPKVKSLADLAREERALADALAAVRKRLAVETSRMEQVKPKRKAEPHGTYAGYMRHYRRGEAACVACRAAYNEYHAEYRGPAFGRRVQPCGTYAAYRRHVRKGEEPCEPCRLADRIYQRNHRAQKTTGAPAMPPSKRQEAA